MRSTGKRFKKKKRDQKSMAGKVKEHLLYTEMTFRRTISKKEIAMKKARHGSKEEGGGSDSGEKK